MRLKPSLSSNDHTRKVSSTFSRGGDIGALQAELSLTLHGPPKINQDARSEVRMQILLKPRKLYELGA